ncbi:hypothetical protein FSP39_014807 [Pinctada imbricata]|uniref:Uncharacterized protein n=1 Tax=Pinctada imbricata TaxID=66713 RepID=A0AA88YX34_PINIB|nr:hypothetical protein FSP39_014807 [Pinctada imbricata]
MMLKYCPKKQHFSYEGMVARTQLAALDHNNGTERDQAVVQKGERAGELMYKQVFPKCSKRWVLKPIYVKKNFNFRKDLMSRTVEVRKKKKSLCRQYRNRIFQKTFQQHQSQVETRPLKVIAQE